MESGQVKPRGSWGFGVASGCGRVKARGTGACTSASACTSTCTSAGRSLRDGRQVFGIGGRHGGAAGGSNELVDACQGRGLQSIFEGALRDTAGASEEGTMDAGLALEVGDAGELRSGADRRAA